MSTAGMPPETKYAKSAGVNIAYRVIGDAPLDLVFVSGWVSTLELAWEHPDLARFYRRLASFSRLVMFDKADFWTGVSTCSREFPETGICSQSIRLWRRLVGISSGGPSGRHTGKERVASRANAQAL